MRSKIFILLYTILCFCIVFNRAEDWKDKVLKSDPLGYHLYLPAIFIYNDLEKLQFFPEILNTYSYGDTLVWEWHGIFAQPTGKRLIKYCTGTALMESPFFLAAHAYNTIAKQYPTDGYSLPYQWGAIISNIFWTIIGLFFLRGFLRRYYTDNIVLATLVSISLATNLYNYTAFQQGMSHPYSFAMIAAAIFFSDRWYKNLQRKDLLFAAIAIGLVVIIRPVNVLFAIVPIFWNVSTLQALRTRLQLFRHQAGTIIGALLTFMAVVSIQLIYWKYITDHWIVNSYGKEHFLFNEPRVFDGLFSYQNGWFVYTPIMFLAIPGFICLWKKQRQLVPVLVIFLSIMIYVIYSWWCWWYAGSFGARAMIDFLPVMAIPLAALYHYVFLKKLIIKCTMMVLILFFCALNIFQTYQFSLGILTFDHNTKAYYWRVFGKLQVKSEDQQLLLDDKLYWKEWTRLDR